MTPEAFAARCPRLWRLAMAGAHEGIRRHGLLTTRQICARAGLPPFEAPRRTAVALALPDGTAVVVTDNSPLSFARLAPVLDDGLTPADWLRMLDDRAFLWPRRALGERNLTARRKLGYESEWQVYDTLRLLAPVWDRAEIAPLNTGSTIHTPSRRGLATFAPLADLGWDEWRRRRRDAGLVKGLDTPKEVTIRGGAPAAGAALIDVRPAG